MTELSTPSIHIVDDDAAVRRALVFLLEGAQWRVSEHVSGPTFLESWMSPAPPGCLILDIRMPHMSGLELLRIMKDRFILLPVIVLTGHADVPIAVEAMKLGARDFIEKPFKDQVLIDAVNLAVRADIERLAKEHEHRCLVLRLNKLSARELEVACMLAEGLTNKLIGHKLEISERTVQVHRLHVMDKLGIHSTAELAALLARKAPQHHPLGTALDNQDRSLR
jgi:two-component system response regulator FixJ